MEKEITTKGIHLPYEGDEIDVKIEDFGRGGDRIARLDVFVVLVNGAKMGDEVKIKINSTKRNFYICRIVE